MSEIWGVGIGEAETRGSVGLLTSQPRLPGKFQGRERVGEEREEKETLTQIEKRCRTAGAVFWNTSTHACTHVPAQTCKSIHTDRGEKGGSIG